MMDFDNERSIGIKITKYESLPKCISILRKYLSESMGIIRQRIESNQFVFVCDFTDTQALQQLASCHDELVSNGCSLYIQEQNRMISRDILQNLLQMHKEIHEETMAEIDSESDSED